MALAEFHEVIPVEMSKLYQTILRYEDYPQFLDGCTGIKVERPAPGKAKVTYNLSLMKEFSYTVETLEDAAAGKVEWKLLSSEAMKKNSGRWELKSAGPGKTEVRYVIDVEFKVPVPSFIVNKIFKSRLSGMVNSFADRAKTLTGTA